MAGEKKFELPSQKKNGRRNSINIFHYTGSQAIRQHRGLTAIINKKQNGAQVS
jgi:hypothetical protein